MLRGYHIQKHKARYFFNLGEFDPRLHQFCFGCILYQIVPMFGCANILPITKVLVQPEHQHIT